MMPKTEETAPVKLSHIDKIDWLNNSLAIGVELPNGGEDWSTLDIEDLRILHALLTKQVYVPLPNMPHEAPVRLIGPVCEASKNLNDLADAVASMIRWYERGHKPAR